MVSDLQLYFPPALFFVNFKTALVLAAFLHIFGNLGRVTFFRYGIDKKLLLIFGIPSVILTLVGASLVNYAPQEILKAILGLFLILFSIVSFFKPDFKFQANNFNAMIGGGLSGFLAGLIGTGGALRGAFLTAFDLKKEVYIATAAEVREAPAAWRHQLKAGGRLIYPKAGSIFREIKKTEAEFSIDEYKGFSFVPFIGQS